MAVHALDGDFRRAADAVTWMPAHGAAHTIGVARDSNGECITAIMWRANRLVDVLAKSAAGRLRLPKWIFRQVEDMAALVQHHCAKLGVVTRMANAHTVTVQGEDGVEKSLTIRDSTAERPNWRLRSRKRKASGDCAPPPADCNLTLDADSSGKVQLEHQPKKMRRLAP